MAGIRAYLRLVRVGSGFTAASNAFAGYAVAFALTPKDEVLAGNFPWAMASACLLAWGGMALNDFFDRGRDKTLRPDRPIPSGDVAPTAALAAGLLCFALGLWAAVFSNVPAVLHLAVLIALFAAAYDAGLKRSRFLGSLSLGACRMYAMAMGAAAAVGEMPPTGEALWLFPEILCLFIIGVTWTSSFEEEPRPWAWLGIFLTLLSALALAYVLAVESQVVNVGPWQGSLAVLVGASLLLFLDYRAWGLRKGLTTAGLRRQVGASLLGLSAFDLAVVAGQGGGPWLLVPLILGLLAFLCSRKFGLT